MNKLTNLGVIFHFVIVALSGCSDEPKEQAIDYISPKSMITSMVTGLPGAREESPSETISTPI